MDDPTEFCPTLPEPYEALVREFGSAKWSEGDTDENCPGSMANIKANHAAAEAEHALRVALREVLR